MDFEKFTFGSIRIDGTTYDHDVVIDRGEVPGAKRSRPRSFAMPSDTRRSLQRRRSHGNAAGS